MARKIRTENDCVGCAECIGCGRNRDYEIEYLECDSCGNEVDKLFVYDGKELCEDCLFDEIETIE